MIKMEQEKYAKKWAETMNKQWNIKEHLKKQSTKIRQPEKLKYAGSIAHGSIVQLYFIHHSI